MSPCPFLTTITITSRAYIYIVIHRQTVSFYQNSSVWLDTQDARSRDRNPSNFTLDCDSDHSLYIYIYTTPTSTHTHNVNISISKTGKADQSKHTLGKRNNDPYSLANQRSFILETRVSPSLTEYPIKKALCHISSQTKTTSWNVHIHNT